MPIWATISAVAGAPALRRCFGLKMLSGDDVRSVISPTLIKSLTAACAPETARPIGVGGVGRREGRRGGAAGRGGTGRRGRAAGVEPGRRTMHQVRATAAGVSAGRQTSSVWPIERTIRSKVAAQSADANVALS